MDAALLHFKHNHAKEISVSGPSCAHWKFHHKPSGLESEFNASFGCWPDTSSDKVCMKITYRETASVWAIAVDTLCIAGQKYVLKDTWNWTKYTTVQIILERFNTKTTYISNKKCAPRHKMSKECIKGICCVNWYHKHFVPQVWAFS